MGANDARVRLDSHCEERNDAAIQRDGVSHGTPQPLPGSDFEPPARGYVEGPLEQVFAGRVDLKQARSVYQ